MWNEAKADKSVDEMVAVKADMPEGIYREGCAILSRMEAKRTGSAKRRSVFSDACATVRVTLASLRKIEPASVSARDTTQGRMLIEILTNLRFEGIKK